MPRGGGWMKLLPPDAPASVDNQLPPARIVDLERVDYEKSHRLQLGLVEKRRRDALQHDLLLLAEHPATFTLGRRGGREDLIVSEDFLRERNIPLVGIERGGNITYHGPGQLVIYPVIHLRKAGLTVAGYVRLLEEVMLHLAAEVGVTATRDARNHGVWVEGKKLGSVGIAIRHGVSFHGLALNVSNSLEPFSWIHPCGLTGVTMTSLSNECGVEVTTAELKQKLRPVLESVFTREFIVMPGLYALEMEN